MIDEEYFYRRELISSLLGLTKKEVIELLGLDYNDIHEKEWIYRREGKSYFWQKKYMLVIFNQKDCIEKVELKYGKKILNPRTHSYS